MEKSKSDYYAASACFSLTYLTILYLMILLHCIKETVGFSQCFFCKVFDVVASLFNHGDLHPFNLNEQNCTVCKRFDQLLFLFLGEHTVFLKE